MAEGMAGAAAGEAADCEASERGTRPGKLPRAPPGLGERHAGAAGVGAAERERAAGARGRRPDEGGRRRGPASAAAAAAAPTPPPGKGGRESRAGRACHARGGRRGPSPCRHDPKEGGRAGAGAAGSTRPGWGWPRRVYEASGGAGGRGEGGGRARSAGAGGGSQRGLRCRGGGGGGVPAGSTRPGVGAEGAEGRVVAERGLWRAGWGAGCPSRVYGGPGRRLKWPSGRGQEAPK